MTRMKKQFCGAIAAAAAVAVLCAIPSIGFASSRKLAERLPKKTQELSEGQQRQLLRTGKLFAADWYGYVIKGTDAFLGNHGTVRGAKAYCVQGGMPYVADFSSYSKIMSDDGYVAAQSISEHDQNDKNVQAGVQYLIHQHLEQKPSAWESQRLIADKQVPQVPKDAAAWWDLGKSDTVKSLAVTINDSEHVVAGRQSSLAVQMKSPTGAIVPSGKHTWSLTSSANIKLSQTRGTAGSAKVDFILTSGDSGWVKASVDRPQGWFANTSKQTLFYVSGNSQLSATANVTNHAKHGTVEKEIDEGVATHGMANTTTVTATTGVGTLAFSMGDVIAAPAEADISHRKIIDVTDNRKDITDQFEFSTKPILHEGADGIEQMAVWKAPKSVTSLPDNHTIVWTFDVSAKVLNGRCVQDQAWAQWNGHTTQTEEKKYCLWEPRPNKAWIARDENGQWNLAADPKWTNAVGADKRYFENSQSVGAVVNGVVQKNLIAAPDSLVLSDDYRQANWLWTPDDLSAVKVYAKSIDDEAHSAGAGASGGESTAKIESATGPMGEDVTAHFAITHHGTVISAAADDQFLTELKAMPAAKRITLFIPGKISVAYGRGWGRAYADYSLQPQEKLSTCAHPQNMQGGGSSAQLFVNSGSQTINGKAYPTNEPNICVHHSPDTPRISVVRSPQAAKPVLPQTGVDAAAALFAGTCAVLCGIGALRIARRRR